MVRTAVASVIPASGIVVFCDEMENFAGERGALDADTVVKLAIYFLMSTVEYLSC